MPLLQPGEQWHSEPVGPDGLPGGRVDATGREPSLSVPSSIICRVDQPTADNTGLDTGGLVRRVRRVADISQRGLADALGISRASIGRLETDGGVLTVGTFERILAVAGYRLAVLDAAGSEVSPMRSDAERDNAARRYPAHLDATPPTFEQRVILPLQRHRRAPKLAYRLRDRRDLRRQDTGAIADDHPTAEDVKVARRTAPLRAPLPPDSAAVCWCDPICETYCVDSCTCRCEIEDVGA